MTWGPWEKDDLGVGQAVEDVSSVRNRGKHPVEGVLLDTLGEEGDDFEKRSSIRAELLERGGGE